MISITFVIPSKHFHFTLSLPGHLNKIKATTFAYLTVLSITIDLVVTVVFTLLCGGGRDQIEMTEKLLADFN